MAVTPGTEPKVMRKAENAAPIVRGEILLQPGALRPTGTIFGTVQRNQVPLRAAAFGEIQRIIAGSGAMGRNDFLVVLPEIGKVRGGVFVRNVFVVAGHWQQIVHVFAPAPVETSKLAHRAAIVGKIAKRQHPNGRPCGIRRDNFATDQIGGRLLIVGVPTAFRDVTSRQQDTERPVGGPGLSRRYIYDPENYSRQP